jgi:hypothetical protein
MESMPWTKRSALILVNTAALRFAQGIKHPNSGGHKNACEMNGFMLQMKATSYLKAMLNQKGPAQTS